MGRDKPDNQRCKSYPQISAFIFTRPSNTDGHRQNPYAEKQIAPWRNCSQNNIDGIILEAFGYTIEKTPSRTGHANGHARDPDHSFLNFMFLFCRYKPRPDRDRYAPSRQKHPPEWLHSLFEQTRLRINTDVFLNIIQQYSP